MITFFVAGVLSANVLASVANTLAISANTLAISANPLPISANVLPSIANTLAISANPLTISANVLPSIANTLAISANPLPIAGNDSGFWYVGDRSLQTTTSDHALCTRVTNEAYAMLQPLMHRPVAIAIDGETLWLVADSDGISLYSRSLPDMKHRVTPRANYQQALAFRGFLVTELRPTDVIVLAGNPVVVCSAATLSLFTFSNGEWTTLPTLHAQDARVTQLQGQLIAAVPHEDGIAMWHLQDDQWQGGEVIHINGTLVDLITKDDWPIIVLDRGGIMYLVGVQHGEPVEIASLKKPKGRWGLTESAIGLSAVGVERIGITTVIDIGWPSGELSQPIVLQEQFEDSNFFVTTITFILPLILLIVLLKMRGTPPQKTAK